MDWPLNEWSDDAGVAVVQGIADAISWTLMVEFVVFLALVVLFWQVRQARRFWCPAVRRDVEAEFETFGPPGLRWSVAVRSCSAFDPPTAVTCDQRCADGTSRRWEAAASVPSATAPTVNASRNALAGLEPMGAAAAQLARDRSRRSA